MSPNPKTPIIDVLLQFGRDLTLEARQGKLLAPVGREPELQAMFRTLCCRTKRNPLLVGPAGVGKTAIVEGFALRVVSGDVPEFLKGVKVILIQPSLLVAGSGQTGVLEKRLEKVIAEASQEGVILFIDEVHAIIGAGGAGGTADVASLMKPALAREDIACIAATTDNEYRRFIVPDPALERRFQPIRVAEMGTAQVFEVLQELRDHALSGKKVMVPDAVLHRLIHYADKYMRNRAFPDKAVDLLEQCVADVVVSRAATVDFATAESVAERVIGIPLDIGARIDRLRQSLAARALLSETDLDALAKRLSVTMRGLDMRMERPNAVLLLTGEAAKRGRSLAEAICEALFETRERFLPIELGSSSEVTQLLGAPPSFVGHGNPVPIHRIKDYPWCVVLFERVDESHPHVQRVVGQALEKGFFVDGENREIPLSDAIVILTAPGVEGTGPAGIGFKNVQMREEEVRTLVRRQLAPSIADEVDLFWTGHTSEVPLSDYTEWLEKNLLSRLAAQFSGLGVQLQWGESFIQWLKEKGVAQLPAKEQDSILDNQVTPVISDLLGDGFGQERTIVVEVLNQVVAAREWN